MPSKYTSKREQVTDMLETVLKNVDTIDRAQFNLQALRAYGASEGVVDSVLEIYVKAGELRISKDTIEKVKKKRDNATPAEEAT